MRHFNVMSPAEKRDTLLSLGNRALDVWESYAAMHRPVEYTDCPSATPRQLDTSLPNDALNAVRAGVKSANFESRYMEPLRALRDGDLDIPTHPRFAFYGIYNLHRRYNCDVQVNDWQILTQLLSAIPPRE
jgi:hypothetical protein